MISYFTIHLSLNQLVKEFLKLVNVWRSYRQNGDCFMRPIRIALLSSKMLISPDKLIIVLWTETVTSRCYINRQIMWVYYQQLSKSNFCRPVLTYWLTDWRHQWLTDCWVLIIYNILLWQLFFVAAIVYSWSWDFYMADVNKFLIVN